MTSDERQQTVDFLRKLAEWLEDGEELEQQFGVDWQPLRPSFFESVMGWKDRVRVKPKPMEVWFVQLTYGGIYYESDDTLAVSEREKDSDYVRTVHLREVQ
jgi:hypothetical protein